ncbi:MAG TPA: hypothetical protein VHH34_11840 [Pseudonocardiaceae bacterium]|nr:hypothetical protein [Pseudonocardiaceae bacterium]
MHWITRTTATAVTTLALAVPAVGIAQAAPAAAPSPASVTAAADCKFVVTGNGVRVRVFPSVRAQTIKFKNKGDRVTGACNPYHNEGRNWTRVSLAGGGHGWMATEFLRRV